jgi:hypothetical protein
MEISRKSPDAWSNANPDLKKKPPYGEEYEIV